MQKLLLIFVFLSLCLELKAQNLAETAESVRIKYKIPEIGFAVVSAGSILELEVLGTRRINADFPARQTDRFHIGSNTKAITSFIAALLVREGKISWETKFFELFPGLKAKSRKDYYNVTLKDLLTFRAGLPTYTYTFPKPSKEDFSGDEAAQRLQFAAYFLKQKHAKAVDGLTPSNVGYVLAGLMLEKASGKTYQALVKNFGDGLQIDFGFDQPNLSDITQTWGHDAELNAVAPAENYKLNWLLAAGNINASLPDYAKFVQLELKGLQGKSNLLAPETFELLLSGLPKFSFGWFNERDEKTKRQISFNEGNAGAFITKVCIIKNIDRAFIVFTNAASAQTSEGISVLLDKMKEKYGR